MERFIRWLLDPDDPRSTRIAKTTSLVLLAGLVVTVALVLGRPKDSPDRPVRNPGAVPATEIPLPKLERAARPRKAAPDRPSSEQEIARAMDRTGIRHHVQRLRMAVVTGNKAGKASAQRSLRRYGSVASEFLGELASSERNPAVRLALDEVRTTLR